MQDKCKSKILEGSGSISEPGNQFTALLKQEISKEKGPDRPRSRGSPKDAMLFCIPTLKTMAFLSLDL